jgi:hypothetical protein
LIYFMESMLECCLRSSLDDWLVVSVTRGSTPSIGLVNHDDD